MRKRSAPRTTPDGFEPGQMATRQLSLTPGSYNAEAHTVSAVFSTGAQVRRYGMIEELSLDPGAVDLARAESGRMAMLFNHNQDQPIGVVVSARLENGVLAGDLRFNETPDGQLYEGMVARGELASISVGYRVTAWQMRAIENETEIWVATRWELYEVSLVPVPADPNAAVRSAVTPAPEASNQETDDMLRRNAPAPGAPAADTALPEQRAAAPVAAAPDLPAERARSAAIFDIGSRAGMAQDAIAAAIASGETADAFRARAFDHLVASPAGQPSSHARSEIIRDETETRRITFTDALTFRLIGGGAEAPSDRVRSVLDMSLAEMAAEVVGDRGRFNSFARREEVLRRAFHSTSDFPIIFENAINRTMAARYAALQPVYRGLGRSRTYVDFRDHIAVRPGDFPTLQPVNPEGGEIKAGTFSEAKEKTAVKAYGVRVGITRQMLVNDNLGAIQEVLNDQATAVAQFEEAKFFELFASDGPTLLETTRALFNTTDKTKAGTAAAITVASLSLARADMMKKTTKDGRKLSIAPSILLVSPDKLTEAEQIVTAITPAQSDKVNPFSGRLRVVGTAQIDGNAWYLFAEPSMLPVFEYGLLEGYTAPRMRIDEPFGVQGMSVSVEHDFGCGAIDFRGAYKNAGA